MLRNVLGTRTLGDILSDRVQIAQVMYDLLAVGTLPWGVSVERVEVKDVRVPEQLMRAMAAEKSSKALMFAAQNIGRCPPALQVRPHS